MTKAHASGKTFATGKILAARYESQEKVKKYIETPKNKQAKVYILTRGG